MRIKSNTGQFEITPDLIEPQFGGICGVNIDFKPDEMPVLKVDMVVLSSLDIQVEQKNTSLRLTDFNNSVSDNPQYKEVSKIIYADGTEANFLTTEEVKV